MSGLVDKLLAQVDVDVAHSCRREKMEVKPGDEDFIVEVWV